MKRLFTVLLLLPMVVFSQQKKDTKIIATVSDTSKLFDKVINLLYTEDYIVKVEDKERGMIVTEARNLKADATTKVFYKLRLSDSTITISGQAKIDMEFTFGSVKTEMSYIDVYFGGSKGSGLRKAWNEMDRLAKELGSVSYTK
jgi:hypothetical protein